MIREERTTWDEGHDHTVYVNDNGNGYTSKDKGHEHTVKEWRVQQVDSPHGEHRHGLLW